VSISGFIPDYTIWVLMTLLTLDNICEDGRDVMLIGDVALLKCDLIIVG